MLKSEIICLVVVIVVSIVLGLLVGFAVVSGRVEAVVVSCVETEAYENTAAKVQANMNLAQGNYTNAIMFGSMAKSKPRYITVVEYDGELYEITTSKQYEVGSVIKVKLPK